MPRVAPQPPPSRPIPTAVLHRRRRVGAGLIIASINLLGWVVRLAATLPAGGPRQHWSAGWTGLANWTLTWVGLDCAEAVGLLTTGVLLRRAHRATRTVAAMCLSLFVIDAWFDIMTSASRTDLWTAVACALLAELPIAALLAWVAFAAGGGLATPQSSKRASIDDLS